MPPTGARFGRRPFSFFALITNALSQRCEVIFRQRHRDAWTVWPSPEIADQTANETLSKAVDLDARRIAVRAGHARFFRFGGFPKHFELLSLRRASASVDALSVSKRMSFDNDKRAGLFQFGVIIGPSPQASDDRETNISLPPDYAGGDNVRHHAIS